MNDTELLRILLSKIDDLKQDLIRLDEKIDRARVREIERAENHFAEHGRIREDISALKIKAGVWGLIGGAIAVITGMMAAFAKKIIGG